LFYESEKETRRKRIDKQLVAAGWMVTGFSEILVISDLSKHEVTEFPTDHGPADYALVVNGRLLGVV
jgi:type I restriction enzyme R subunit